jgi:hypothetical protein
MPSDPRNPAPRASRAPLVFAILCTAVFTLGVVLGYHSVYRNISVAALNGSSAPARL